MNNFKISRKKKKDYLHLKVFVAIIILVALVYTYGDLQKKEQNTSPLVPRRLTTEAIDNTKKEDPLKDEFLKVALKSEFGNSVSKIIKWNKNIRVYIYHPHYIYLVDEFVKIQDELNFLSNSILIEKVATIDDANLIVYLCSHEEYAKFEKKAIPYLKKNYGLAWVYWNRNLEITKGSIYVDVKRIKNKTMQKHYLREEFTQSLGMLSDSHSYPESIFFQGRSQTTQYSELDKRIISRFLQHDITPGMTREELLEIL